jgi:purine-binding chemotaxis protein CheW
MTHAIDSQERRPWCFFRSAHNPYAVCLESVVEIFQIDELAQLPLSPPCLKGLCALRREVIPVIAPRGPRPGQDVLLLNEPKKTVLAMRSNRGTFGILIDREGVHVAEEPALEHAAPTAGTRSMVTWAGNSHEVLDPDDLWKHTRAQIESWFCVKSAARN